MQFRNHEIGDHRLQIHDDVIKHFDVFFDLRLNKWVSKQPWGWWFETPSRPLWRHRNAGKFLKTSGTTLNSWIMCSCSPGISAKYCKYTIWIRSNEKLCLFYGTTCTTNIYQSHHVYLSQHYMQVMFHYLYFNCTVRLRSTYSALIILISSMVINYTELIYSGLLLWWRLTPSPLETSVPFQWIVSKWIWSVNINEFEWKYAMKHAPEWVVFENQYLFSAWLFVTIQ